MNDIYKTNFIHSNLFIFILGQLMALLCASIVFAIAWGRLTEQLVETTKWRSATDVQVSRLTTETNNTDYMLMTDRDKISAFEEHLKYIEDQVRRLDVIQLRIDRLEEAVNRKK